MVALNNQSGKTKVLIIESESGWGQKVDEVKEFDTPEEAEQFVRKYNREHNPLCDEVPSWYMFATLAGRSPLEGMMR